MKSVKYLLVLLFTFSSLLLIAEEQSAEEQSAEEQLIDGEVNEEQLVDGEVNEEEQLTEEEQEAAYMEWAQGIWNSMTPRTGGIALRNGLASLNVPQTFYYLSPEDSEKVLVEVWGNPPGGGKDSLGMLFPEEYTPFDDESWAVTIDYEEEGYVSDEDAADLDYDDLLEEMQSDTRAASEERVAQGYEPIELLGWASPPYYDQASHKMYWAKELKFGDAEMNTLNYNIRILGRKGVLVLNFIANMEQKKVIDDNLQSVMTMANFSQGSTYGDFNPDIDQIAAYGLGGLVAGKVLLKTGFLAVGLVFLKKFGIFLIAGIGVAIAAVFKSKKSKD